MTSPRWSSRHLGLGLGLLLSLFALQVVAYDSTCPSDDYSTPVGLDFKTHCDSYILDYTNSSAWSILDSFEDCMVGCSVAATLCIGAQYDDSNGNCTFLYGYEASYDVEASSDQHYALVPSYEVTVNDTSCGFSNGVTNVNGNDWKVTCDHNLPYGDMHQKGDEAYAYHADSLAECMGYCVDIHPLCKAVVWDADMAYGYSNCHPKNENSTQLNYGSPSYITHSGELVLYSLNTTCPGSTITSGGISFNITCNSENGGGNMTAVHTDDFDSCIDECVLNDSCVAVNWEFTMEDGFSNCYLQSSYEGFATNNAFHSAVVANSTTSASTTSTSSTSTSSPSSTSSAKSSSGGSSSLAWVAGPVVGGVVAIALLAGVIFCLRRRKRKGAVELPVTEATQHQGYAEAYAPKPQELSGPHESSGFLAHNELQGDHGASPVEMAASPECSELPADNVDHGHRY